MSHCWCFLCRPFELDSPRAASPRVFRWLVVVAMLGLMGVTWPLWIGTTEFPEVPLVGWAVAAPRWLEWLGLAGLLGGLGGAFFSDRYEAGGWAVFVGSGLLLVLLNQHRLQPWMYQFLLLGLIFALTDFRRSLTLARLLTVSIYFYSALSKADFCFLTGHGQYLLGGLWQALGISWDQWTPESRQWLTALLPLGELLVAVGLCVPRTQRLAAWVAMLLHATLMLIFSPLGLNHQPGVLLWNLFFIGQAWLLFPPNRTAAEVASPAHPRGKLAELVTALAVLLPLLETWGWWDHWPAWVVYAARSERLHVFIPTEEVNRLPVSLLPHRTAIQQHFDGQDWTELRLDRWSLAVTKAPITPELRFQVGVIADLVQSADGPIQPAIQVQSAANRWTGERVTRWTSLPELQAEFRLNAQPRE